MIITLCGSARFESWFHHYNELLSLAGHTVFSLGVFPSWKEGEKNWYSDEEKRILDQVHISKIINSDAILVLNAFAYLGESTLNEIEAARIHGKDVYFLESWGKGCGIGSNHYEAWVYAAIEYCGELVKSPIDTSCSHWNKSWLDLLGPAGDRRTALVKKNEEFVGKYKREIITKLDS